MAKAGWIDVVRRWVPRFVARENRPLSFSDWLSYFTYNGVGYPLLGSSNLGEKQEVPQATFEGYIRGLYKRNGIIFACMAARMLPFSEARFQFQRMEKGRPGELFGNPELQPLEEPWPNGTTGDLLSRLIQDADLAGNAFTARRGRRVHRMRPDWTTIVVGSASKPSSDEPGNEIDAEIVGLIYQRGGHGNDIEVLLPGSFGHFAPIPDPEFRFRGMSWLMPVLQEVLGDQAATTHKLKFFENGATPNLAVALDKSITDPKIFDAFVEKMEEGHAGVLNAYRTLYLAGGATTSVVGANMRQIDFKTTQGAGETRIAAAARIPPIIVGLSEGLEAATYSNYGQARRAFADGTLRPLWRNAAGSLAPLVNVPAGARLWYDDRDIPFLQEDVKDAAEIRQLHATTIKSLIDAGYEPDSVIAAVTSGDFDRLVGKHTGLYSVQLQPPQPKVPPKPPELPAPTAPIAIPAKTEPAPVPTPAPAAAKRTDPPQPAPDPLTAREREVAELVADGLTNKEIAERAGVSERTVERAIASASAKLKAKTRAELVALLGVGAPSAAVA